MINEGERRCPFCGGRLQPRGRVKRKIRLGDGETMVISMKRYSCAVCKRWHREIPSDIAPYKQYTKPIIEKFCAGKLSDRNIGFESYPVEMTKTRWKNRKKNISHNGG